MPHQPIKPGRWSINQAGINPKWDWAWRDLRYLLPFWPEERDHFHEPVRRALAKSTDFVEITPGFGALGSRMEWSNSAVASDNIEIPNLLVSMNDDIEWALMFVINVGAYTSDQKALLSQNFSSSNGNKGIRIKLSNDAGPDLEWTDNQTARTGMPAQAFTQDGDGIVILSSPGKSDGTIRAVVYDFTKETHDFGTITGVDETTTLATKPLKIFGNQISDEARQMKLYSFAMWDRFLTDDEMLRLIADPFGMFRHEVFVTEDAGGDETVVIAEPVGVTDDTTRVHDAKRTPVEPVGVTDETPVKQGKEVAEAVGVTDETPVKQSKVVTEPVGLTDATPVKQSKVLAETVGLTDTTSRVVDAARVIVEAAGVADITTRVIPWKRTNTEAIGVADTISTFIPSADVLDLQAVAVGRALDRIAVGEATARIAVTAPQ